MNFQMAPESTNTSTPRLSFSIIIVCLNAGKTIRKAIDSVLAQHFDASAITLELLIIDGASKDDTPAIVKDYGECIGYFTSEPDNGIYHAMNKGRCAAKGDILFFLNADDYLADTHVIKEIAGVFQQYPQAEIVFGDQLWDRGGQYKRVDQSGRITKMRLARRTIQHQTLFARRELFARIGGFNETYRIVSDYEWILRAFLKDGCAYRHCGSIVTVMATKGLSWTQHFESERREVMRAYFSWWERALYRSIPTRIEALKYAILDCYWPLRDLASKYGSRLRSSGKS